MPSQYSPARKTIGDLLSMTNPPIVVPDWQRNFSWTTSEVETFWQDLLRFDQLYPNDNINDQEYFLGAIVIVDTEQGNLLLDGQQRIATAAILLSTIRDFLKRYSTDAAQRLSSRYLSDYDDATERTIYKISLNRFDRDFFRREILESREANYTAPAPRCESHQHIRKARSFFEAKFDERYTQINDPKAAQQWSLRILKVLTSHMSVVAVISQDEDNASSVFETLNDRGIGLSTPDLLRNLVLRRAQETQSDEVLDLWGEILGIQSDAKLDGFFRHFWISREGDVKTRSLYREIKKRILETDWSSLDLSRTLRNSAKVYEDIVNGRFDDSEKVARYFAGVAELGAKVLYPPYLSIVEACKDMQLIEQMTWALMVAYVRHSLVCGKENSQIEDFTFSLAKRVRENPVSSLVDEIREFAPSDGRFRESFASLILKRQASARYLLREIEQSERTTEELDVGPPSRVHVEHIYPLTPKAENRWEHHDRFVSRIGNLTLLSRRLNISIQNGTYQEKKDSYIQSELLITKKLPEEYADWNPESVESRQKVLADKAVDIWSF
ncbi:MAG TPA: DUF262 domain-containing HNH endonuclease family protein [Candidatus Hydrogenedentes bacterium]|nr:DUF262 domain-containing HNH endonuclease family protein [Candidatus Hydrogenedentota bacterium]